MLDYVKLTNFKCYESYSFNLNNLTVFCGGNSVGKSTAIQGVAIPFQSDFSDRANLNSSLVSLGVCEDLHNKNNLDSKFELELKHKNIETSVAWGYSDLSVNSRNNELDRIETDTDEVMTATSQNIQQIYAEYGFQFLEAERFGPRNNFSLRQSSSFPNWLGSRGEYTWETIYELVNKHRLSLNEHDPRIHLQNEDNRSVVRNIELWMSEVSEGFHIDPSVQEGADVSYSTYSLEDISAIKPINMGFGLTYSLSVVTALLVTKPGGLVVIENPEAHLHPKGQSYLGRLIALSAESGVQVIIETHSDHVINGIRLMVRVGAVRDTNVSIYYISSDNNKQVTPIQLNKNGQMSEWPEGFFDQQAIDMEQLMKGRLQDES